MQVCTNVEDCLHWVVLSVAAQAYLHVRVVHSAVNVVYERQRERVGDGREGRGGERERD
jgi:hypothetical protein